jgi:polyhydroxyalkanoate synthesis regulator phasin
MQNKKIVIPALALGVLMLVGAFWVGKTTARAATSKQSVVDRLVERFNLNKDEVTGVFDEMQQERQQERQAQMESRLDEAVKDGVITTEQKQALLQKQVEWQERQREMMEERQKWMEESGIDFEKLAPYRVGFGGKGFGRGFGPGHPFGGF